MGEASGHRTAPESQRESQSAMKTTQKCYQMFSDVYS